MSNESKEFFEFKNKFTLRIRNNLEETFKKYSSTNVSGIIEPMKYSSLNDSKFIRSLLVYATGSTLNINFKLLDQHALAVELIHTYTLIHDDLPCMDDDDIRRGAPSCHIAFGESSAILAGDALQTLAFEILSENRHKDITFKQQLLWINYLSNLIGVNGVAGGQYKDLSVNNKTSNITELQDIYMLKTAYLIAPCIMLPYILEKNYPTDKDKLYRFAIELGLGFQIKDDLLGYTSSSEVLGKTKNKDKLRNQPNYVSLLGVDGTIKKLEEHKELVNTILKDIGFNNSMLFETSNYIFNREF